MTREVRYSVADDTVVRVSPEGVITAGARGLTTVLARGMGQVAGAQIVTPLEELPWGDRRYQASDAEGHQWTFAAHVRDVDLSAVGH